MRLISNDADQEQYSQHYVDNVQGKAIEDNRIQLNEFSYSLSLNVNPKAVSKEQKATDQVTHSQNDSTDFEIDTTTALI